MSDALELAHAAIEKDDFTAAALWFGRRLQEQADDTASRAWLGQCLCTIGRRADGIAEIRRAGREFTAIARRTGQTTVLLELASELQHWRDIEGALALTAAASEIEPSRAQAHQLHAVGCAQVNRVPEALEACERALELVPDDRETLLLRHSLLADAKQYDAAREGLERLLAGPLEPRQAYRAQKELARVLDKLDRCGEVFPLLHKASALTAALAEFSEHDREAVPNMIRSNQFGFDAELIGRWKDKRFEEPAPVFVAGFLRSGTTLTQEVLDAHPQVFVSDEVDFVTRMLRELHRRIAGGGSTAEKLGRLDQAGISALRKSYWATVADHFGELPRGKLFVDKFTMNTIDAAFINTVFPDARFVFVLRDPRDVCLSCFMQLMVPSLTTVQLLHWNDVGRFYAQVMNWWLDIRPSLTMRVHCFRYEDAVTDFERTFRGVFDFLSVEWDERVADFHKRAPGRFIATPSRGQVAQPLYSSSVGRWRKYAREFAPLQRPLAPLIRALGYE